MLQRFTKLAEHEHPIDNHTPTSVQSIATDHWALRGATLQHHHPPPMSKDDGVRPRDGKRKGVQSQMTSDHFAFED